MDVRAGNGDAIIETVIPASITNSRVEGSAGVLDAVSGQAVYATT